MSTSRVSQQLTTPKSYVNVISGYFIVYTKKRHSNEDHLLQDRQIKLNEFLGFRIFQADSSG